MIKWIKRLLALFVFLIPWQARFILRAGEIGSPSTSPVRNMISNGASSGNNFWEYGTVGVYATDILFFIILVFVGVLWVQKDPQISKSKFLISKQFQNSKFKIFAYGLALTAYVFLSILWSFDKPVALYSALKLFEGVALFLIVRRFQYDEVGLPKQGSEDRLRIVSLAFVASAVVQSVLAIAQFFTQSVFTWPFSGIAPQDPSDLGVSVVQFADERWLRAYGSFPHPNVLGGFLAIALLLLLTKLFRSRDEESGIKNQESWRLKFIIHNSYFIILVSGLFFTFSRAAWIAAIVATGYWLIASGAWRERIIRQTIALLIAYCLLLTAIFFPLVRTRIGGGSRLEMKSNQERTTGYREAVQLIKHHPFFGVGIGNYTAAVARELRPNDPAWSYQPVHNVPLLILSELGLVGFGLLALGFWQFIRQRKLVASSQLLIALAILASFDHSLWTLHSGILLFWGIVGLVTSTKNEKPAIINAYEPR